MMRKALSILVLVAFPLGVHAGICAEAVQGEIAWNYEGAKRWNPDNVARLCRTAESTREPARCFEQVMHGGVNWGKSTRWKWSNAVDLCRGTRDAAGTIECFRNRISSGLHWREAIDACQWDVTSAESNGSDENKEFDSTVVLDPKVVGEQIIANQGDETGAKESADPIAAKYRRLGGPSGRLGPPDGSLRTNPGNSGKRRRYANGHIYWSADTGAHVVYDGPIWDKWAELKWEQSKLGYPVQDPRTNPDETGKRQRFENGHIYWHPRTGAHAIYDGPIWRKWAERRWEQGPLGYPVSEPRSIRGFPGDVQRFEHGTLSSVPHFRTTDAWERAGRPDFDIRPLALARHCVADVTDAFEAIQFGRQRGKNFYTDEVSRADTGDSGAKSHIGLGGHMQGVARLPDGWLVQSHSKGVFLTHFPAKDGAGHAVWAGGRDHGQAVFPEIPSIHRKHVGGLHAYDDIVVVPSDQRVELLRHRGGRLIPLSIFDVSRYQGAAHFASILPLAGGDWLLAVGHDSRSWRKVHRVYFYVIPSLDAEQRHLRYLGRRGRGKTNDDFQSGSLVAECDGSVFFIGTGVRRVQSNAHAKLYSVKGFSRSGGGDPDKADLDKVKERSPNSARNDCSLNAGATFFPTSKRGLAMYCTEKEIRRGQITTREYRDESRS
ncbi:MAG: hypothetical protein U5R46_18950 [Gammaproteobacteria bacterium]|nr:hypothetical protein [Gammaproteobacteria bacterium]